MVKRLLVRLSTRRCHGCADPDPHSHHLTAIGRWRYTRSRYAAARVEVERSAQEVVNTLVEETEINRSGGEQ